MTFMILQHSWQCFYQLFIHIFIFLPLWYFMSLFQGLPFEPNVECYENDVKKSRRPVENVPENVSENVSENAAEKVAKKKSKKAVMVKGFFVKWFGGPNPVRSISNYPSLANATVDVRKILWRPLYRNTYPDPTWTCLHRHSRFEDARSFLWADPRTHVHNITAEGVVFSRTKEGVNIYSSDVSAFAFHGITDYAEEFAVIDVDHFRLLAEEEVKNVMEIRQNMNAFVEKEREDGVDVEHMKDKRVVVIGCHPRCGGTLVTALFSDMKGVMVINEPHIFHGFFEMRGRRRCARGSAQLLRLALFSLVKPFYTHGSGISTIVIKLPSFLSWLLEEIMELDPTTLPFVLNFLFVYRSPLPAMNSWMRRITEGVLDTFGLAGKIPLVRLIFPDYLGPAVGQKYGKWMLEELKRFIDDDEEWEARYSWLEFIDFDSATTPLLTKRGGEVVQIGVTNLPCHFFAFWLVDILVLRYLRTNPRYADRVMPIRYDDLIENPTLWTEEILPFCEMDPSEATFEALNRDSQRQSDHSQATLRRHVVQFTEEDLDMMREYIQIAGFEGPNNLKDFVVD